MGRIPRMLPAANEQGSQDGGASGFQRERVGTGRGQEERLGARMAGFMSIKAEPRSQIPTPSSGLIFYSLPLHTAYLLGPTELQPLPASGKTRW